MKIEHLPNTDPEHPKDSIIRAFDFDSSEACHFRNILSSLANGSISEINLSGLPFVSAVGGCNLVLKVGTTDKGTIQVSNDVFECTLTSDTWQNAEGLVEPFCKGNLKGYQWLYNLNTDIQFLFSPNGKW
jgi:hypothetical protein